MSMKCLTSFSKEEFKNFISSIDVILSDCDGVLWQELNAIKGSPETVNALKQLGKRFFYVTNDNTKTRSELVDKCKQLNYKTTVDEIVCTSFLVAVYLKKKEFKKKVYIVGGAGLGKELDAVNIEHYGIGPDNIKGDALEEVENFKPNPDVGAVVVGFDKYFSYPKMMKAATYLSDPNIHFIGTNCDTEKPSPNSNKFPGTGCFIKAIQAASNRTPMMIGKPETFVSEYIIKEYGLDPKRTLMVGDNCSTDILLGKRCGFKTLLVLTGVTTMSDVGAMKIDKECTDKAIPDYYTNRLSDILDMLSIS